MATVRVRFGPSPTGNLHLGGFRTALINYLFARKHNGKFILRIEDTDQSRTIPGTAAQLEDDLNWLGLKPDESPIKGGRYGPYTQSERLNLYSTFIKNLIESSSAYECFCSQKRLDLIRREAIRINAAPGYDNKCRNLTRNEVVQKKAAGESFVIRFKVNPEPVELNDALYGKISLVDKVDPVIVKSDGFPTYHYANVVDDHLMEITHVLRGNEWQSSTGMHLQMYRAFNWKPPIFAHLPVLLNADGTKFSKRQASLSIKSYREQNSFPICLANFVTKSGGGFDHSVDKLFTLEELVDQFEVNKLNNSPCRLDFNLLTELNRVYIHKQLEVNFDEVLKELQRNHPTENEAYLKRILEWAKPRITRLKDLDDMSYLWTRPENFKSKTPKEILKLYTNSDMENIEDFVKTHNLQKVQFLHDLRYILCGLAKGPPIAELLHILGPDEVKSRIEDTINNM